MLGKREPSDPNPGDKRKVRRIVNGRFASPQLAVGKAPAADERQPAQTRTWKGPGDRGDR